MRSIPLVAIALASLALLPTAFAGYGEVPAVLEQDVYCAEPNDPQPGVVGAVVYTVEVVGSSACVFTVRVIQATCVLAFGRPCDIR